jgi:hypothetical protein
MYRRALAAGLALGLALTTAAPAEEFRLLKIDGLLLKWGEPVAGSAAEVSWGFAAERRSFPDTINCGELAPVETLLDAWDLGRDELHAIAVDAFGLWSGAAGIAFREAAPGETPDILIGAQAQPHKTAFANVWWDASAAQDGIAPLTAATVCFNPGVGWPSGPSDPDTDAVDLRFALAHEIGHAIGLDHPGPSGALMGFRSLSEIGRMMPGDIAGALALYGARLPSRQR